jgi:hypothetical protein
MGSVAVELDAVLMEPRRCRSDQLGRLAELDLVGVASEARRMARDGPHGVKRRDEITGGDGARPVAQSV